MTDVSTVKFFKFLDTNKDWFEKADTNSDDVVIKAEFRNFLNAEKSQFQAITGVPLGEDIINKFWDKLDTSKENKKLEGHKLKDLNAIGKNTDEFKQISYNIESLNVLEIFYQKRVIKETPYFLKKDRQQAWRDIVYSRLETFVEDFVKDPVNKNSSVTVRDLSEEYMEIRNSITADECDDHYYNELKLDVLEKYEEYEISEDPNVIRLVDSYIENVDRTIDAEEVLDGMKALIDAYLATAGISGKTANAKLLAQHGYTQSDDSYLNDLQKAVLTKRLTESLHKQINNDSDVKALYDKNKAVFDQEIANYISNIVDMTTYGEFNTVTVSIDAFKNSDSFVTISRKAEIESITGTNDFKTQLGQSLGYVDEDGKTNSDDEQKFDDALENYKDLAEYQQAIEDILNNYDKYLTDDGQLDSDKVSKHIIDSISDTILFNADTKFENNASLQEILDKYNEYINDASHIVDEELEEEKKISIAIDFCRALYNKTSTTRDIIIEALGTADFENAIRNMDMEEIEKVIETIQTKINELIQLEQLEVTDDSWGALKNGNITIASNSSFTTKLNPEFTNGVIITADRITYSCNSKPEDLLSISPDGSVTIKPNSIKNGVYKGQVAIMVDNVIVAVKDVIINIHEPIDLTDPNNNITTTIKGYSIIDVLNNAMDSNTSNNIVINLCNWQDNITACQQSGITAINTLIDEIATALKDAGFNIAAVDKAVTTTKNFYEAAINAISDRTKSGYNKHNISFSFCDAYGNRYQEESSYYQHSKSNGNKAADTSNGAKNYDIKDYSTGIQLSENRDWLSGNEYRFEINLAAVFMNFQRFYNM